MSRLPWHTIANIDNKPRMESCDPNDFTKPKAVGNAFCIGTTFDTHVEAFMKSSNLRSTFGVLSVVAALGACGGGNDGATDTASGALGTPTTDSAAGGMAGMDHNMNRPAAKDADHEFLRMMSDHHEGLIQMATAAMNKGSNQTIQGDAHRLHTQQQEEQKRMIAMIQRDYDESLTPMVMGSNKSMVDQLQSKTGTEYDRTFYSNVVAHHREAIQMVDQFISRLNKPEVRQMAEKMKMDQQKEITEFESKARG